MTDYDVLIVGAGILGLSTAYHIKVANRKSRVLVVDKNVAAGLGSTVNSAAAFRCFFSSSANFDLADSSVEFYKQLEQKKSADLKMRWCGYLWAFNEKTYKHILPIIQELKAKGFTYKEYLPQDLAHILGMTTTFAADDKARQLNLEDVHRAIFIPKAGLINVMSLVHFYESEFLKLGGEIKYHTEVSRLIAKPRSPIGVPGEPLFWQDVSIVGVETALGAINAKKTVVATGAWLSQLLDPVGIECFIKPRKRQVFNVKADNEPLKNLLHTKEFSNADCLPFTVLPGPSVYIRPNIDGEGFGIGYADEFPRAFQLEEHPKPETDFYRQGLHPVVSKYFPQFERAESSGGFAGLYEINTLDEQPVIFEDHNLVVVGGGSGSGIMKADAIGRIAAAVYAGEEYATLFGGRRFKTSILSLKKRCVEPEKLVI